MRKYWIPKISAIHVITASEVYHDGREYSFDCNRPQDVYYMEMTQQDECVLFDQLQFLLGVSYSENCLSDAIVFLDFEGIFNRKPTAKAIELQDAAQCLFHPEGFRMDLGNGWHRYVAFERSSSMSKDSVLSFIRADMYEPLKERIQLGMCICSCKLAKLYAYNGLMFTSGIRREHPTLLSDRHIVVIPNPTYTVRNAQAITVKDDGTDLPVRTYSRIEQNMDIEVKEYDGEGLLSKETADWLDPTHEHHSFQIRLPYIKGVLHEVDFKKLFRELRVTEIIDLWGERHPVDEVEIILTESMCKGLGWMEEAGVSWKEYCERCRTFRHALYISGQYKVKPTPTVELNYQFLNTLPLTAEEFRPLDLPFGWDHSPADDPRSWLTKQTELAYYNLLSDPDGQRKYLSEDADNDNLSLVSPQRQRAMLIRANPRFMGEPIFGKALSARAEHIRQEYSVGHLLVTGDNRYLSDDLMRLLAEIVKTSVGEGKAYAALSKEFLSENAMYAPLPHYMEQPKYLLLRSPHIARNEEVTAFPLKKIGKYRKKYLSHLGDVVMVDSRSLIPERLGGADYDGDYVKTIAEPLILKHIPDSNELPVLHIPAAQGTDADANDWLMRFSTVKNTFSQRIGQISNAALRRGIAAYNENASSDQKQKYRDETEALAILTGLEIDSAKTGVKPNLDAYLNDQSQVKSLFLQYKDKLERLEKRHWYDPTPKEALTEFFAKPEWRRVTSNLERLPYCAWLLKEQTPPHLPEPATDSELFSFARVAGWETQIDPKAISRMKEVITSYETAQTRCRIRYYSAKDYSHLSDIQRILTSRGQEELYDPIKLYEAVNTFSGEHIRSALELVQSQQWQFMAKEDRPLFLKQLYPLLGVGAKRYEDLFCDFRNSGFRILGDVLVDLVRLHRSEEASDHLIRRKDSDLQKRMLIGCKDSRNPQEQILRNCREVISSKMREYMTDNLTSEEAVMAAVALGKRRFALEVYPGVVKSLCCTEEKAERRLFQK